MDQAFAVALERLEQAWREPQRFSAPFARFLPVTGAAVSTLGDVLGSQTLSATDDRAARLDEMQFDLGEGPCWDALRTAEPVSEPAFDSDGVLRWPVFAEAARGENIRAIFAFPLIVGSLRLGAVDLYSDTSARLGQADSTRAAAMARVVSKNILRAALEDHLGDDIERAPSPMSRRRIHQATGVVLAQLGMPPDEARLIIHGHAFATERPVSEVAEAIVSGDLRFVRHGESIEVEQR